MDEATHTDKLYTTQLRAIALPPELRERSGLWIALYAAKPHVLIAVALGLLATVSPWFAVPFAMLAMLAAQRHFQTLVHDASHQFFHPQVAMNDRLANWISAGWIGMEVSRYRKVHLQHHAHNGSALDPEHVSFQTVRQDGGLVRMILRYATMMESVRLIRKYFAAPDTGRSRPGSPMARLTGLAHIFVCQGALLAAFSLAGAWWGYGLWLYLAVTFNPLLSRLRFLAEHPGEGDATVTTLAPLLETAYFAPQSFNYHCEHHGWPMIPPYRLARLHRYLREESRFYDLRGELISPSFIGKLIEQDRLPAAEATGKA